MNLYEEAPKKIFFGTAFFQSCSHKNVLDIVLFTLRGLWKNLNKCVLEFSCRNPHGLVSQVAKLSVEYVATDFRYHPIISSALTTWSPPYGSLIKINVDVAWDPRSQLAIVVAVARYGNRSILFSSARMFPLTNSVLHVKLLGC